MIYFDNEYIEIVYNWLTHIPEDKKSDIRFYLSNKREIQTRIKHRHYFLSKTNLWSEEQVNVLAEAIGKKHQQMINS